MGKRWYKQVLPGKSIAAVKAENALPLFTSARNRFFQENWQWKMHILNVRRQAEIFGPSWGETNFFFKYYLRERIKRIRLEMDPNKDKKAEKRRTKKKIWKYFLYISAVEETMNLEKQSVSFKDCIAPKKAIFASNFS